MKWTFWVCFQKWRLNQKEHKSKNTTDSALRERGYKEGHLKKNLKEIRKEKETVIENGERRSDIQIKGVPEKEN